MAPGMFHVMLMACGVLRAGALAQPAGDVPPPPLAPLPTPSSTPAPRIPVSGLPAEGEAEAVVLLRDGQQLTGFIVEQDDTRVLLRIVGIPTTLKRSEIEAIQVLPPVLTRFQQLRAAVADDDIDGRVMLAEWLRARGQFAVAYDEVEAALQREPTHVEGRRLKALIVSQQELLRAARARQEAATTRAQEQKAAARALPPDVPALSPEQINLLKVYEVDLGSSPRILIDRDTITALLAQHAGDPLIPSSADARAAFYALPPSQILDIMFRVQARDLYGRVRVLDHPRSVLTFRDQVHRTLIQNACATTACHGGAEAGRLQLRRSAPQSDATVYTNFLILDRFRTKDGRPLIDYDKPARSTLLQYALPRQHAVNPHPVVPTGTNNSDAWKPFYRNEEDDRFIRAVEWITTMYRPRPQHPVEVPTRPPAEKEAPAAKSPPGPER